MKLPHAHLLSIILCFCAFGFRNAKALAENEEILTYEQVLGTVSFPCSPISHRKYYPADTQVLVLELLKKQALFSEKEKSHSRFHDYFIELLGAIGDKHAVPILRAQLIEDATTAAEYNKNIRSNLERMKINTRAYGRALGILLYRKVPGSQELYNEMLTPEFWKLVDYPTVPPGGKLRDHAKLDFIVRLMIEATEYAGDADGPKFQKQMSKIISPDTDIDNGYGGVFPFENAVKRDVGVNNASEDWLWMRGDKYELTDKRRAELQSYYDQFAPPVMKDLLKEYLAKKTKSNN